MGRRVGECEGKLVGVFDDGKYEGSPTGSKVGDKNPCGNIQRGG